MSIFRAFVVMTGASSNRRWNRLGKNKKLNKISITQMNIHSDKTFLKWVIPAKIIVEIDHITMFGGSYSYNKYIYPAYIHSARWYPQEIIGESTRRKTISCHLGCFGLCSTLYYLPIYVLITSMFWFMVFLVWNESNEL